MTGSEWIKYLNGQSTTTGDYYEWMYGKWAGPIKVDKTTQLVWHTDSDKSTRYAKEVIDNEVYKIIDEAWKKHLKEENDMKKYTCDLVNPVYIPAGGVITTGIKMPVVKKIVHSGPCTIVFWEDNTKTIVRKEKDGNPYDEYAAFTAALAKKIYGTNSKVRKIIETKTTYQKEKK